jgi:hypothetical protein
MATEYPERITVGNAMAPAGEGAFQSLLGTTLARIQQIVCGWRGHDSVLQFDQSRMFLECMSCGRQSPGWQLEKVSPHVRVVPVRGTPGRMAVARKVA